MSIIIMSVDKANAAGKRGCYSQPCHCRLAYYIGGRHPDDYWIVPHAHTSCFSGYLAISWKSWNTVSYIDVFFPLE